MPPLVVLSLGSSLLFWLFARVFFARFLFYNYAITDTAVRALFCVVFVVGAHMMELLIIDVPEEHIGAVSQLMGPRKGKMQKMVNQGSESVLGLKGDAGGNLLLTEGGTTEEMLEGQLNTTVR